MVQYQNKNASHDGESREAKYLCDQTIPSQTDLYNSSYETEFHYVLYGEDEIGKFVKYVNKETGNVDRERRERTVMADAKSILFEHNPKSNKGKSKQPHFYRLYKTNWDDLVDRHVLTPYQFGLLCMLARYLRWEDNHLVDPKTGALLNSTQLSKLLGIGRPQMEKTLRELHDKGLISISSNGKGKSKSYKLNSHLLFYGQSILNVNDHREFDNGAYKPKVRIKYAERSSAI